MSTHESAGLRHGPRRLARGFVATATLVSLLSFGLPADADPTATPSGPGGPSTPSATAGPTDEGTTPSGAPTAPASPSASSGDESPSASPSAPGTSAAPESSAPETSAPETKAAPQAPSRAGGGDARAIKLAVASAGGAMAGRYFENIGSFAFTGTVGAQDATHTVAIYRRAGGSSAWVKLAQPTSTAAGAFSASVPVTDRGTFTLAASIAGPPGDADAIVSNQLSVKVEDSTIRLYPVVGSIDSLKDPKVSGMIWPVRNGVAVAIDAQGGGGWARAVNTRTGKDGRFSVAVGWGRGKLTSYRIRARYTTPNRQLSEVSGAATFRRIAVLNAVVTSTTAAEVAKTYRAGCPTGRSNLKTITMNFYGYDQRMHRGVMIVRKDLTGRVTKAFTSALDHRYPIAKMNNPNVYGGNDPKQMADDNTSGFNCRKVVGNPYKMSPHSYGIAIDVNTVRNPYRDAAGTWWPANGKAYIDRSPRKPGMLYSDSYLTRSLTSSKYFWGGLWSPGRDYQHFEYRG